MSRRCGVGDRISAMDGATSAGSLEKPAMGAALNGKSYDDTELSYGGVSYSTKLQGTQPASGAKRSRDLRCLLVQGRLSNSIYESYGGARTRCKLENAKYGREDETRSKQTVIVKGESDVRVNTGRRW